MTIDSGQVAQLVVEWGKRTPRIESIVQEADAPRWSIERDDGLGARARFGSKRSFQFSSGA
jgi:hypothetical protein